MSREIMCSLCEHFPKPDSLDPKALGMGRCSGFDESLEPHEGSRRWDDRGCVIFGPAPDLRARVNWVTRMRREVDDANTAAA